jgi:hypothetical protein
MPFTAFTDESEILLSSSKAIMILGDRDDIVGADKEICSGPNNKSYILRLYCTTRVMRVSDKDERSLLLASRHKKVSSASQLWFVLICVF